MCGRPDRPINFCPDFDSTPRDHLAINAYLNDAATVLGPTNVGSYWGF
ncbi:hypothetical protein [Nocardia sp. NPDC049707]